MAGALAERPEPGVACRRGTGRQIVSTILFGVVVGAIALVEGFIVFTALRMPTRTDLSQGVVGSRGAEAAWTLLPPLLLVLLAVLTFRVL